MSHQVILEIVRGIMIRLRGFASLCSPGELQQGPLLVPNFSAKTPTWMYGSLEQRCACPAYVYRQVSLLTSRKELKNVGLDLLTLRARNLLNGNFRMTCEHMPAIFSPSYRFTYIPITRPTTPEFISGISE
jgi:hypothetical protein